MENPKLYKGIEYVQLNELPEEQRDRIRSTFNEQLFVKILVNGKLLEDCILYKDYKFWFRTVYEDSDMIVPVSISMTNQKN
jgi:hypothetical protein